MRDQSKSNGKINLDDLEKQIIQNGQQIFGETSKSKKNLFSKKWWYGRLMQWTLSNETFKIQMFRFVDTFPSIKDAKQIPVFLKEYFGNKNELFPELLSQSASFLHPALLSKFISKQMKEMAHLFIVGETAATMLPVLKKMREKKMAFTIDLLGEATLSEQEARMYQSQYLQLIDTLKQESKAWEEIPLIDRDERGPIAKVNISVKLSSLDSQIFTVSWEESKERLKNKLRPLLKKAMNTNTFINIDMERYELKDLTLEVFKELISEPDFRDYPHFGIVIQAYLKDSLYDLQKILDFVKNHPSSLTIRLVKGAYWDYEKIHSEQQNWPCPVYLNKWESDKNFEDCCAFILKNYPYLRLGLGSHNIRSIIYALSLSQQLKIPKSGIEFQMLYGMADAIKIQLIKNNWRVREYCPFGKAIPGMAYLVRRLLENTSNESFLRSWQMETQELADLLQAPEKPKNTVTKKNDGFKNDPFKNVALLDFSKEIHRQNFQKALAVCKKRFPIEVPIVINSKKKIVTNKWRRENPSEENQIVAEVSMATKADCDLAIKKSLECFPSWRDTPVLERSQLLLRLAKQMENRRYELASLQVFEVGKNWKSADADVCEAIDFCHYYAKEILRFEKPQLTDAVLGEESFYSWKGRGIAVVIAPWNFPLAILTGMTTACLVSGNTVLIKPAEQSSAIAYELMKMLIDAKIPLGVAQFLPGKGEDIGAYLVEQKDISLIAFTGSKEVGCSILEKTNQVSTRNNTLKKCVVEMGGKNAIIIDDSADMDMAVAGVIESAFDFQGQKCSACSRVLLAKSIEQSFLERLKPAVQSLQIGPVEDPKMRIGPMIDSESLKKMNHYLRQAEKSGRLLAKGGTCENKYFVSPTVFSGIPMDSPILKEEIFGPLLVIIPFQNLDQAINIANDTEFALTGAFYSRSPARIEKVKKEMQVGNLYINRPCTGALVKRHPFGGFKMSGIGNKAGGPDYLRQFMNAKVVTENTVRRGFSPDLFSSS